MTKGSHIHDVGRNTLVLLGGRVDVKLVLRVVILWYDNLLNRLAFFLFLVSVTQLDVTECWICVAFSDGLLHLLDLLLLSLVPLVHFGLVLFYAPFLCVFDVPDCFLVPLQFQAAKSQSVVSVRPILLDVNSVQEPPKSLLVLAELLISASQVEDTGFVIFVEDQSLVVTIQRILVFLHLVQDNTFMVPVVRVQVNVLHAFLLAKEWLLNAD